MSAVGVTVRVWGEAETPAIVGTPARVNMGVHVGNGAFVGTRTVAEVAIVGDALEISTVAVFAGRPIVADVRTGGSVGVDASGEQPAK